MKDIHHLRRWNDKQQEKTGNCSEWIERTGFMLMQKKESYYIAFTENWHIRLDYAHKCLSRYKLNSLVTYFLFAIIIKRVVITLKNVRDTKR